MPLQIKTRDLPPSLVRKMEGPRPQADFTGNGCTYSPDRILGADLRPACHFHDWDYHVGGDEKNRRRADERLYRNLVTCLREARVPTLVAKLVAGIYYRRVRQWGEGHFRYRDGAQRPDAKSWWARLLTRYAESRKLASATGDKK